MIRVFVLSLVLLVGCEQITPKIEEVFTRPEDGQSSEAERVVDSTGWMIPSPWRELVSAVTGGVAVFVTSRVRSRKQS